MIREWRDQAACKDEDPNRWSPGGGCIDSKARRRLIADAIVICVKCPVRPDCARTALALGAESGVWAGIDLGDSVKAVPEPKLKALRKIRDEVRS